MLSLAYAAAQAAIGTSATAKPWTSAVVAKGSVAWFTPAGTVLSVGWAVDSLTAAMLAVVGTVALCVVVFSVGYMAEDEGWNRYFALLALFTGSMSLLVIADSFVGLFIGWELVGACSYLLIGFWFRKPSAAAAATKAFLTTRVGDVGLLVGLAVLWWATGSLAYQEVVARIEPMPAGLLLAAAVCLAIGAMGKSAQFPLHAWLPDAMEGPTPVSALIHAATMVAAGVFLIVRVWPIFELATGAREMVLVVGVISALGGSLIALVQRDIKKVLAYSTISQLGFMFAALGAGAWAAAFFHLMTHAAFKGLLFLASGSVIHGSGTQDLHEMGGLRAKMPVTFATWTVGALALAGIPGFAGFFSKDAVLEAVLHDAPARRMGTSGGERAHGVLHGPVDEACLRRATGSRRGASARESGSRCRCLWSSLAALTVTIGWFGPRVAEFLGTEAEPLSLTVSALAVGLALAGGAIGWLAGRDVASDERFTVAAWQERPCRCGRASGGTALIDRFVVGPTVALCRILWAWGDRLLADGAAEGVARLAARVGAGLSRLQSGDAQAYSLAVAVGVVVMLVVVAMGGR